MLKIIRSIYFYIFYGFILFIMYFVQIICYNIGGYKLHHKSVKMMNFLLLLLTKILLKTKYVYNGRSNLDNIKNYPIVFVSNHQSMYDISPLEYNLAVFHPKFVSKVELSKWYYLSISYNLRKGGSALINRNNPIQSMREISRLSNFILENNYSIIIFPEGNRSRDGNIQNFKYNGLKIILKKIRRNGYLVPISIKNSWDITKGYKLKLNKNIIVNINYHDPIKISDYSIDKLISLCEKKIKDNL